MKKIGRYLFPEHVNEMEDWEEVVRIHPLAKCVLAVAITRVEGVWSAYIDAVPGKNHWEERDEVLSSGAKLRESIARMIFPCFDGIPYAP